MCETKIIEAFKMAENNDKNTLLNTINTPDDLRKLDMAQLPQLCEELRKFIVEALSVNPGHLASSLGVVELTVALHYVFDTPEDRIVWDVGHQAYGHKILTGRRDRFDTNRKMGGIMPFPSPKESEYDTFTCGHASNSISAALGMAVAERLERGSKESRRVVAVIGDGAMSGGLAYEGLNNASSTPNNLLIILNDNNMSIDRSVGGMKNYLLSLNTNETYNNIRFKTSTWMRNHGMMTDKRRRGLMRFNNALKSLISNQQNVFEGMDIRYFGPTDGHDVCQLVKVLRSIKNMEGPKLLHLHTKKGHGYEPAENSPTKWHAPGKFDPDTGERISSDDSNMPPRFQDVFGHTMVELAEKNPKVVGITPAMPTGCSLNIMMKAMPDRAFDVGIAEGHAVTFAAGLATEGMMPFCNIYSAFAQRAYDNLIHDVAIMNLPVVLCLDRAGLVGEDGATHHGAFDLASMRPIPGLTICSPMDEHELRKMMYTAQLPDMGTVVIRYPRGRGVLVDWRCPLEKITVGKGRLVSRKGEGRDVCVLSLGPIGNDVENVINSLDVNLGIVHYDMRYIKPIDTDILDEASTYKHIVTVEDGARVGGLGSAVLEYLADKGCMTKVIRLGLPDKFIEHGTVPQLRKLAGIDNDSIKEAIING